MEAWLGDDHGLTDDQVDEMMRIDAELVERYPDPDDRDEREAALIVAHQLMTEAPNVVEDLAHARLRARTAEAKALAGLRQAAIMLVPEQETEAGFARRANVDRMAVRGWLGKRPARGQRLITLYETNSDLLILAKGAAAWDMGAPGASLGYLEGTFAEDAAAWASGASWEPNEGDGQHPTEIDDDLTAVATWDPEHGVRLLVDRESLGDAAEIYLYGRDATG